MPIVYTNLQLIMKLVCIIFALLIISACGELNKPKTYEKAESAPYEFNKFSLITKCNFETYITYLDSFPLYDNANGKIVKHFRFEDNPEFDFGGVLLFKNSKLGWLQIGKDKFNPELEDFWIKSDIVEVGTTNYNAKNIPLFKKPKRDAEITGQISEESYLNVLNCQDNWVFVEKNGNSGWLAPEHICTNSESNCN